MMQSINGEVIHDLDRLETRADMQLERHRQVRVANQHKKKELKHKKEKPTRLSALHARGNYTAQEEDEAAALTLQLMVRARWAKQRAAEEKTAIKGYLRLYQAMV
jgi:hypothetical protein